MEEAAVVASISEARYQSACDIAVIISLTLSADLPQAPNQIHQTRL